MSGKLEKMNIDLKDITVTIQPVNPLHLKQLTLCDSCNFNASKKTATFPGPVTASNLLQECLGMTKPAEPEVVIVLKIERKI